MPRKVTSLIFCSFLLLGLASCGGDDADDDSGASGEATEQPAAGGGAASADLAAALKNAATAQEVYVTSTGMYSESVDDLVAEGAVIPPGVEVIVAVVDRGRYFCIEAVSEDGSAVMSIESGGVPVETPCEPGS
ncbi:MAG TPA: hypothetical protein VG318_18020 [Actinomycetota bacterium]|nr:hypothetical protein [Actinomycetota bacterium]